MIDANDAAGYQFNIFPNPAKSEFRIHYSLPITSDVQVNIYRIDGSLFKSITHKNRFGENQIKVSLTDEHFATGMYVVKLTTKEFVKYRLLSVMK